MIKRSRVKDGVRVQFVVPEAQVPGRVSVVGEFNSWDPKALPLRRRANGTRSASVVLKPGRPESPALRDELSDAVAKALGKTSRPKAVRFVDELPKTRSAKLVRGVIRRRFLGEPVGDLASVENPDAVEAIAKSR